MHPRGYLTLSGDDRIDEYRAQAYRYRALREWTGDWDTSDEQATLQDGFTPTIEDAASLSRPYADARTPDRAA